MKRGSFFVLLTLFGAGTVRLSSGDIYSQAALQMDKKTLMANNMGLSAAEQKTFWELYEKYQADLVPLQAKRFELIQKFTNNYVNMTDGVATDLTDQYLSLDKKEVDLRAKWISIFRKSLSPKTVARYFQLEHKFDVMMDYDVARRTPLVQ